MDHMIFDRHVGLLYDCAADPTLWPIALEDIRSTMNSAGVHLIILETGRDLKSVSGARFLYSPADADDIESLIPWLDRIPHGESLFQIGIDRTWVQSDHISAKAFEQTDFYQNWVRPRSLADTASLITLQDDGSTGVLCVTTAAGRPSYELAERRYLERLSPHLRRALVIGDLVEASRAETAQNRQLLDRLTLAVIILGDDRRIVSANAAAEKMLLRGDTVVARNGFLRAPAGNLSAMGLMNAIDRAARKDSGFGSAGIGIRLHGADCPPVSAFVLPLDQSGARSLFGRGNVALFIPTADDQHAQKIDLLQGVFQLTKAEARTALLLASGLTIKDVSMASNVSINTVKSHLARVFSKTGTATQHGLVATVQAAIPPICL